MLYEYNNLVWKYINGEEIDNIDELENDYKFMMKVIRISRDKNIYNLCSEEVKSNYEFVRFMIETFKSDKDFIDKIASGYFDKVGSSDITAKELYFIMSEIFNDYKDHRSIFYNKCCFDIYTADKDLIDKLILSEKIINEYENIDMGFSYVIDYISIKSDIITKYYAKMFLNEIFYNKEKKTIEEIIHSEVASINELKNKTIRNIVLGYIKKCDISLYGYVLTHLDLIKEIEKHIDIDRIIVNWDNFVNQTLERKNIIFEQEVNNLISEFDASFDYCDVCTYIDRNLTLPVKLSIIDFEEIYGIDINKISLIDYECLKQIIILAKDLYGSLVIDKDYEFKKSNKQSGMIKGKRIEFKLNKKDNIM